MPYEQKNNTKQKLCTWLCDATEAVQLIFGQGRKKVKGPISVPSKCCNDRNQ